VRFLCWLVPIAWHDDEFPRVCRWLWMKTHGAQWAWEMQGKENGQRDQSNARMPLLPNAPDLIARVFAWEVRMDPTRSWRRK
jgi:hypothetical protein